jgi:hypothetical protein
MDELEQSVLINEKLKENTKFTVLQKIKCAGCINIFMNDSDSEDTFRLKKSGKK